MIFVLVPIGIALLAMLTILIVTGIREGVFTKSGKEDTDNVHLP